MADDSFDFKLVFDVDKKSVDKAVKEVEKEFDAIDVGAESMKKVRGILSDQRDELAKIAALQDPKLLKQRVDMEKKIADARKELSRAEAEARGDTGMSGLMKKLTGQGGDETNTLMAGALGGQGGLGQIGAMVGEAFGGPAGAEIGKMIAEALPERIAGPIKAATAPVKILASSLRSLNSELGPIALGFDTVSGAVNAVGDQIKKIPLVGELLGPAIDAIAMVPDLFKEITGTLTQFAAKASPATFRLFQIAVENVQATIGQAFLPVLNMMTDAVKLFSEVMANVLPDMREVGEALTPAKEAFGEVKAAVQDALRDVGAVIRGVFLEAIREVGQIFKAVTPFIKAVIDVGKTLVEVFSNIWQAMAPLRMLFLEMGKVWLSSIVTSIKAFGAAVKITYKILQEAVSKLTFGALSLPDLGSQRQETLRTETPAAREGRFGGFEEYAKNFQMAAFQAGGSDVPTNVSSINEHVSTIASSIDVLPDKLAEAIAGALQTILPGVGNDAGTREAVKEGVQKYSRGFMDTLLFRS